MTTARAFGPIQFAPCMGGWCALRDHCPHYHAAFRGQPAERLCPPGRDGSGEVIAVRIVAPRRSALPSSMVGE